MKIEALTIFRFIGAALVVNMHFGSEVMNLHGLWIAGSQMVTYFFVLSGFVMGITYFNRDVAKSTYWLARIGRIIPAYVAAIFMMAGYLYIRSGHVNLTALILNLTLTQSWFPPYALSINSPGWSLSVEAFLYLLFPFVLQALRRFQITARIAIAISFLLWIVTQVIITYALSSGWYRGFPSTSHELIYYFPLCHLSSYLLGISGALWVLETKYIVKNEFASVGCIGFLLILIIGVINHQDQIIQWTGIPFGFGSSFYAPLSLAFILSIAVSRGVLVRLLSIRPFVLLGNASYALYIYQIPVHELYVKYLAGRLTQSALMDFSLYFILLTFVSIASYLLYEKPLNRWIRQSFPAFAKRYFLITPGSSE